MKKKLKKWLIALLGAVLPWLLVIIITVSGFNSVVSFFKNLFSWGEKENKNIDINNCTIEELIEAVDDKDIFTEEVLEEMMIDRKVLKYLLSAVNEYNNRTETTTISVECTVTYTVEEEVEVDDDEDDTEADGTESDDPEDDNASDEETNEDKGDPEDEEDSKKTKTVSVTYTEDMYLDVYVSNDYLFKNYEMDWQTIYIMAIFKSMANYDNWIPGGIMLDENGNEVEIEPEKLSHTDIDEIINDFKPSFIYSYNVITGPKSYSKDEAASVPHFDYSATEDRDGTTYYIEGYIPKSELSMVVAPSYIDFYSSGNISTYSLESNFLYKASKYCKGFSISHFMTLMQNLPGGNKVADKYEYIFNLSKWEE